MKVLPAGRYLGRPTLRMNTQHCTVVESSYAVGTRLPSHAHSAAHFCLVVEGGYEERLGLRGYQRQPGSLSFLPASCEHREHHLSAGRHLMIETGDELLEEVRALAVVPMAPVTLVRRPATRLGARLWQELRRPDLLTPMIVEALTVELIGELCRDGGQPEPGGNWVSEVRDLLDAEPLRTHTLADLGRAVRRHPMHVSRSFRRSVGMSVGAYLRRRRVIWAAERLQSSDVSIADVAAAAGFSDQSHFSRWCRKFLGKAPTELRRR